MYHLSVMISEPLYQQLERISQEENAKMSDLVRMILQEGIESHRVKKENKVAIHKLQDVVINYAIMTYCLVEEGMQSLVTEGKMLSEKSHTKAEKLIGRFLDKTIKNITED